MGDVAGPVVTRRAYGSRKRIRLLVNPWTKVRSPMGPISPTSQLLFQEQSQPVVEVPESVEAVSGDPHRQVSGLLCAAGQEAKPVSYRH